MTAKDRRIDRAWRPASEDLRMIGREFREARDAADLSQRQVGAAIGISASGIGRIERGVAPNVPLSRLIAIAAILGLRLSARVYPAGQPLRDAAQVALLGRLRRLLHPTLRWTAEVPIPIPRDLRAWDGGIHGPTWTAVVDAETRIRDAQAVIRRTALKRRDSGTDRVILLLADTRANRAVLQAIGGSLIDDAISGREILRALAAGQDPGGSGVVLL